MMISKKVSSIIAFDEEEDGKKGKSHSTDLDSLNLLRKELYSKPEYAKATPEELETLKQQIIEGDAEARLKLYNHHLRYLMGIVRKKVKGDHEVIKDLFSEGATACYEASQKWDPMHDGPFKPYVIKYILKALRAWLRKNNRFKNLSFEQKGMRKRKKSKGKDKGLSKPKKRVKKEEEKATRTVVIIKRIEPDEIIDPTSNPEVEADFINYCQCFLDATLEITAHEIMLLILLRNYDDDTFLKNPRHRRFFVNTIDYSDLGYEIIARFFSRKHKTSNYVKRHLSWYTPFLEEEFGEKVKQWPESKILKKFGIMHLTKHDFYTILYTINRLSRKAK